VKEQEACRKDVEQECDVLRYRWAIVRHPARQWSVQQIWEVMNACVIMHNMTVEEERDDMSMIKGWIFQGDLVAPNLGSTSF
jgi:hypothetical protein